jgi:release factor glutamine methyltransferase
MGGTTLTADWTIREVLNWTRGYLKSAGIQQPRLEAEILLAHTLEVDRLHLYLSPDKPLTADERTRYRTVIKKRRGGVPLQLLVGEVGFYGLRFRVHRDALIPRAETEELLDRTLKLVPRNSDLQCLDLGTGVGVIAVCLARYLPRARVTAVDLSSQALELASENAVLNGVDDRITFLESDWFANVDGRFDLIVSNPPYVAEDEMEQLPIEVREHEPRVALDGGPEGLEQIALLLAGVSEHLAPGGHLLLEIGHGHGERVGRMMGSVGLDEVSIETDLAGRERFAVARCR